MAQAAIGGDGTRCAGRWGVTQGAALAVAALLFLRCAAPPDCQEFPPPNERVEPVAPRVSAEPAATSFHPSPDPARRALPFSESVEAGGFLWVSGAIGTAPGTFDLVPGGIEAETRATMENLRLALERRGCTFADVVKASVFLVDMAEWPKFNEVYSTYFADLFPARSALGAAALARGARVEVEVIAKLPQGGSTAATSAGGTPPVEPFLIEYYYKAKWGYAAEFIELFKRNYLPQIEAMQRQGRILAWVAHVPRHHASEESRWDFRLQITWRDALTAHDDHHPEALIATLFPDRERHKAEEKRRFEILIAHWDVLVEEEELGTAPTGAR